MILQNAGYCNSAFQSLSFPISIMSHVRVCKVPIYLYAMQLYSPLFRDWAVVAERMSRRDFNSP